MTNYRWTNGVATAIAACAVAYQTAVILETLPTVSLTTKLGVPLATVAAALLPVLAEAAWRSGERVKSCLMVLPVLVLMAYVLPSGVSRLGEAQQARVSAATLSAEELAKARSDLARADKLVSEAQAWVATECASGKGKKCDGHTFTLNQRQAYQQQLAERIKPAVEAPWLPVWHPALLPIGLELMILAALFYGMGPLTHTSTVQALTFERPLTEQEISEIKRLQVLTAANVRTFRAKGAKHSDIAAAFGLNQGRVSELLSGKRESVTLH